MLYLRIFSVKSASPYYMDYQSAFLSNIILNTIYHRARMTYVGFSRVLLDPGLCAVPQRKDRGSQFVLIKLITKG